MQTDKDLLLRELKQKEYLGDAVYVQFDGFNTVLTTENGISETNRIILEPEVMASFTDWIKRLTERIAEYNRTDKADADS